MERSGSFWIWRIEISWQLLVRNVHPWMMQMGLNVRFHSK